MNPIDPRARDPLSPEERALADGLRGPDPHPGPPAALDARILAAARAAVDRPIPAPQRRRHRGWGARLAVPGTLVTALGTAAAFALVVGVAWQLRPAQAPLPSRGEGAGDDPGFVAAEVVRREPVLVAPPPPPATAAKVAAPAPAAARARPAASPRLRRAPVPATPPAAPATPAVPTIHQDLPGVAGGADTADAARPAAAAARGPGPSARAVGQETAAPTVRRPLRDDLDLPPDAWLQRIRERRDAGDLDGARASLRRFRQEYPRLRVPTDLQRLGR